MFNKTITVGICPICRVRITSLEPHIVEDGFDYHNECYIKHSCRTIASLEKKIDKKTISLEEASVLEETKKIVFKLTSQENKIPPKPIKKYDCLVCKPILRESSFHSNIERKLKKQEILRSQRWAWGTFNIIESQTLIEGEQLKQITDGK